MTFTYEVTDANGDSDIATVTITVEGTNKPPEASDDVFGILESALPVSLDVLGNDSDPDGDSLTITNISTPGVVGTLSINSNMIVYDDGGAFDFLGDGQSVTQSFTYTISDGNGGTDTASVDFTVNGVGSTQSQSTSSETLENGQNVSVSLTGPNASDDGTGDFSLSIGLSAVVQPNINVLFVVDTSGSTISSVLAQEVAALKSLTSEIVSAGFAEGSVTISIVPFSTTAGPDATGDGVSTFTIDTTDDFGTTDQQSIETALDDLSGGGLTNYVQALNVATQTLVDLETANGQGTNVVYFLSDGRPVIRDPITNQIRDQTEAEIADAAADLQANAQISAFEIGDVDAVNFLDQIDNTGGTTQVDDPSDLSAALLGSPIPEGSIVAIDLFVFNDSGVLQDTVNLNPADFTETLLGFEFDINGVTGLADDLGEQSVVQISIGIDDDDDGLVDVTIQSEVDVFGL